MAVKEQPGVCPRESKALESHALSVASTRHNGRTLSAITMVVLCHGPIGLVSSACGRFLPSRNAMSLSAVSSLGRTNLSTSVHSASLFCPTCLVLDPFANAYNEPQRKSAHDITNSQTMLEILDSLIGNASSSPRDSETIRGRSCVLRPDSTPSAIHMIGLSEHKLSSCDMWDPDPHSLPNTSYTA